MRAPYDEWFGDETLDATYGYDEAALRAVGAPEEPPGFAEFWQDLYRQARAVHVRPHLTRSRAGVSRATYADDALGELPPHEERGGHKWWDVYNLEFTSLGNVRLGGWVVLPVQGPIEQAVVVGHGYGGREAPSMEGIPERTAAVFPVTRGQPSRSLLPDIPAETSKHVLHGIESIHTYVHGGSVADIWCATTALLAVLPEKPEKLSYIGSSFGGGIGAMAMPWDARFDAAVLRVPSFGNHPLRLTMPCRGSGEAVRRYAEEHPEVREVLHYFDAAVAARRIRMPSLLGPALWDPSVPPPGQFAVCNAVPENKEIFVLSAGHAAYPGDAAELARFHERSAELVRR